MLSERQRSMCEWRVLAAPARRGGLPGGGDDPQAHVYIIRSIVGPAIKSLIHTQGIGDFIDDDFA